MLVFSLEYREALDTITGDRDMKLRQYEMDNEEWVIAHQLCKVLKVFKDATLFFSRNGTPNIATVIPAMDRIDEVLATSAFDSQYSISVQAALAMGKKTLNRYYSKTDHSEVYRIAMVLHPRHKLLYFEDAGWEDDWIATAEKLVRDRFESAYCADRPQSTDKTPVPITKIAIDSTNIFDNLPALAAPKPSDLRGELERYLSADPEYAPDVLAWWHERRSTYPRLSRMAMDYLSIPATSVDVERVFSKGRILLSHVRSRLSVQSTRALMCIGAWSPLGYVKDRDVRAVTALPELDGVEEELREDWDAIQLE